MGTIVINANVVCDGEDGGSRSRLLFNGLSGGDSNNQISIHN
jgi:hypothetical protein